MHELPRPEYPRPQFVRPEWSNLNGPWEFCFDDENRGLADGWWDGRSFDRKIVVPFPYQSNLSGIADRSIHEVVWYARAFRVPPEWREGDVLLHVGACDYHTTVWVNGRRVGEHRGGHVPFSFDIAPYLQDGDNRVVFRVEDRQDWAQPRGKQAVSGRPEWIDYYCTTGVWQTVWLEPCPAVRIDELRVTPVGEQDAVEVEVYLHGPGVGWSVRLEALDGASVVARTEARGTGAVARLRLDVPNARRWSPRSPNLYTLRARLLDRSGNVVDEVGSYFGLRNIRIEGGRMLLDGRPIFPLMVLDQGYWPESYLAAPSDAALRADVEWIKRFGFNGARKHQKVEDPRWLYWCDRLGLLVWGEMANARQWSPEAERMLIEEWEQVVRRDYNHPCIIAWVPINESWGVPDLHSGDMAQHAYLERLTTVTRRLDPTRPVVANDGWENADVTDLCTIHDYSKTAESIIGRYVDLLRGGPPPARNPTTPKYATFAHDGQYRGQPVMLTEVGGFLRRPDLPREQWDGLYDAYGSYATADELLGRYRELMGAIGSMPFVAGVCYTQLTDIEQEANGLLTYDRKPLVEPERIAEIHRECFGDRLE